MDFSVESTLQPVSTGDGHAASRISRGQGTDSTPSKTPAHSTAGAQLSGSARFNIRSAKTRSQKFGTEDNQKGKDLRTLRSVFEPGATGSPAEGSTGKRADRQEGPLGARPQRVSTVIKDKTDPVITTHTESWTNQPKSLNQDITVVSKPYDGQLRRIEGINEKKPEIKDFKSQDNQLGQETGGRGRAEWKRGNFANRSKSLDWRAGSGPSSTEIQGFWENHGGRLPRRAESLERGEVMEGGRATSTPKKVDNSSNSRNHVSSKIKACNSAEQVEHKNHMGAPFDRAVSFGRSSQITLALERASKGQSLPSRIKPRLSQCGIDEEGDVFGLHQNGMKKAVEGSAIQSISDRIEKLFASTMSDTSIKRDTNSSELLKAKRNSAPVGDWLPFDWQGTGPNRGQMKSANNNELGPESSSQLKDVSYQGERGGTFPRRYFRGERSNSDAGTTQSSRSNGNDGNNLPSLRWSGTDKEVSACSGERSPGRLFQTQTSLTERKDSGGLHHRSVVDTNTRSLDRPRSSLSFSLQPSSLRDMPKDTEGVMKDTKGDPDGRRESERDVMLYDGKLAKTRDEYRQTEGKLEKDADRGDNSREGKGPKLVKAMAVFPTSPTSQETSLALRGVNKESKQDKSHHAGSKPDDSIIIQPMPQSSVPQKRGGEKEKWKWKEEEEDVFRLNSFPRGQGKRQDEVVGAMSSCSDNVRSKIHRFESLSQQNQSTPPSHLLRPRRAFSVPEHIKAVEDLKKSDSDRTVGGVRGKWPVSIANTGDKPSYKTEDKGEAVEEWKREWAIRSISVDEIGQRRECRGMKISGSGISSTQQPKQSPYKEPSHNSTASTEPQWNFKASSDEPDYSKDLRPEAKCTSALQQGISRPIFAKDPLPTPQTNQNKDGISNIIGMAPTSDCNHYDSVTKSECGDGDKTPTNSSNRSPFIPSNKGNGSSGSTYAGHSSNKETQALTSTPNATDTAPLSAANVPPFGVNHTPYVSTPASESEPSHFLPLPAPGSSSSEPHPYSESSGPSEVKDSSSLSVRMARWNSDEEEWDDDDDDDEGTMKGSNYDSDSAESSVTITSNMSQSDHRSFSVSLADLCHFGGVDYLGYNDGTQDMDSEDSLSHRTASLSSDISALSCVSILPTDELDRLLEDVRSLGDESLKNYEDVQVVVLHKDVGCGLGFTVAGGVDQNKPVTVHKVFPCGLAAHEGSIREGDQVLSINGTALKNSAHWEALRTLRRARTRNMAVVVLQKGGTAKTLKGGADHTQGACDPFNVKKGRTLRVVLEKSSTDLGFSLEGGLGSSQGDGPLTIKKVFQGGPVDDVFPGDELLEIKGHSLLGLRRLEAWNLIKKLPPGPVEVVLHRPFK
ncbi:uncharacterized protein si:dkey-92i15.4 isoform X2 [Megalops cyprinoides]|uniref:uncharacterized protein si:dkey-92i15.4 isoform X2 n=1 Tax=Megalops cyprinoides TaxID=118141 RepID=UPI0018645E55|nr:uncharacterized protein si:dkey-92i15.4 isoform X2 [Megalops cyprinoides]